MSTTNYHRNLSFEEYVALPGFNFHGMKDFAISPLQYWYKYRNPNRKPEEPSPAKVFGSALHTAILEPARFQKDYCRELDPSEYDGVLRTIEDIRAWYERRTGSRPKGNTKESVIAAAKLADPDVLILDDIKAEFLKRNAGKTIVSGADYERLTGCYDSAMSEPHISEMIAKCADFEVSCTRQRGPVMMKSRIDGLWLEDGVFNTLDVKSFSIVREFKTIEETIADAIWYNKYNQQMVFNAMVLGWPDVKMKCHLVFIQSDQPHECRIKVLTPTTEGSSNLYWNTPYLEIRNHIRRYSEFVEEYGDNIWRSATALDPLVDEEMKGLIF